MGAPALVTVSAVAATASSAPTRALLRVYRIAAPAPMTVSAVAAPATAAFARRYCVHNCMLGVMTRREASDNANCGERRFWALG